MSALLIQDIRNTVLPGDCVQVMRRMGSACVDFILTDPPYLCRYRSRSGQTIANDNRDDWLEPACAEMYRLLKPDTFCVSFYGWNAADRFICAWRKAGFRIVGHIVCRKCYGAGGHFLECRHETAYLLAKGDPVLSGQKLPDVLDWDYTGNRLHPTQKPINVLQPLVEAFCPQDGLVLDPFCGSGSTLVAARLAGRSSVGIELEPKHCQTADLRLQSVA